MPSWVSGPDGSVQYAPPGETLTIVFPIVHPPPTATPFETQRSRRWTAKVPAAIGSNVVLSRFQSSETKATNRPSGDIVDNVEPKLMHLGGPPSTRGSICSVVPATRSRR